MIWTPRVTVAAVIEREQHFLLVEERVAGNRVFNQPAGHLERGESLVTAVCREVLEETARTFRPSAIVGIYRWSMSDPERTYLRFCFTGEASEPVPGQALDEEIVATHWLRREQLQHQDYQLRSPMVLRCIDDYLAGMRFPLEALHEVS